MGKLSSFLHDVLLDQCLESSSRDRTTSVFMSVLFVTARRMGVLLLRLQATVLAAKEPDRFAST